MKVRSTRSPTHALSVGPGLGKAKNLFAYGPDGAGAGLGFGTAPSSLNVRTDCGRHCERLESLGADCGTLKAIHSGSSLNINVPRNLPALEMISGTGMSICPVRAGGHGFA